MKWMLVRITTSSQAVDAFNDRLLSEGAKGISVTDPADIAAILNDPESLSYAEEGYLDSLGDEAVINAYFQMDEKGIILIPGEPGNNSIYPQTESMKISMGELNELLRDITMHIGEFLDISPGKITLEEIDEEDWADGWKKFYRPIKISDHIVIVPSWEEYVAENGEKVISLDPGSAFGTGSHATTAMCAQMLDETLYERNDIEKVLDLGCGSGILSILCCKLSNARVDALDIDPSAVKVARENCAVNKVEDMVNVREGAVTDVLDEKYDIVAANIIADVIKSIAIHIPEILKPGGVFIASGIIADRKDEIIKAYESLDLRLLDEKIRDEWTTLKFVK